MSHIFISYSHKDEGYVHKLQAALQDEGFDAWIDDRIDYGDQWLKVIQKHLDECDAFVIVMSQNSFESEMVQNEVTRAREKQKTIFPLLLDGDNWLIVQAKQFVDVRDGSLPTGKFYRRLEEVTPRAKGMAKPGADKMPTPGDIKTAKQVSSEKRKANTRIFGIMTGVVVTIVAGLLASPLGGKWLAPAALPTATSAPARRTVASSQAVKPNPVPTETLIQTPTPISIREITDDKGVPMMLVPAGEFIMGSDIEEPDEQPVHEVFLPDYYIDKHEVTNALYKICVDDGACTPPVKINLENIPRYYESDKYMDYPVVHVEWEMALSYCEWRGATLPTETEWEKAARGPYGRIYPWGDEFDSSKANFCDYSCDAIKRNENFNDGHKYTAPVGNYPDGKSLYGVLDLAGNVWEWVAGEYRDTYILGPQDFYLVNLALATEPPVEETKHIARGGSWFNSEDLLRSSYRAEFDIGVESTASMGFRCAKDAP